MQSMVVVDASFFVSFSSSSSSSSSLLTITILYSFPGNIQCHRLEKTTPISQRPGVSVSRERERERERRTTTKAQGKKATAVSTPKRRKRKMEESTEQNRKNQKNPKATTSDSFTCFSRRRFLLVWSESNRDAIFVVDSRVPRERKARGNQEDGEQSNESIDAVFEDDELGRRPRTTATGQAAAARGAALSPFPQGQGHPGRREPAPD